MKIIFATEAEAIGRFFWRFEVISIDGEKVITPMFRRIGETGPWHYPADFAGTLPTALTRMALSHVGPLARALETPTHEN